MHKRSKHVRPVIVKLDKNKDEFLILGDPPYSLNDLREIYGAIESVLADRSIPMHLPKL